MFPRLLPVSTAAFIVLALVFSLVPGQAGAQSLNPAGSIGVHDPVLIKDGGTYYLFHTGGRIPVKTSTNLVNWANAGSALSSVPSWHASEVPDNRAGDLWAPDIVFRDGKYWLYYSVSSFGSQVSAVGLATRTSLSSGSWQDQGMALDSKTFSVDDNAIDPNFIADAEGNPWLCWGSWWSGIYIVRLDPASGKPAAGAEAVHIAGRGGSGIEAPFIVYARGYFHLFTSWDKCCEGTSSTYNMRYGRSAKITGPYVDKSGKALASGGGTLLSDGSGLPGGHNGVFIENDKYYIVYHVYDGRNSPASLQIRRLHFDADDWPTLDPAAAPVIRSKPAARFGVPGIGTDWSKWFDLIRGRKPPAP